MHPVLKTLWEATPKPLQDIVATAVDRVQHVEIPGAPHVDRALPVRLFIAPANYAGQGYRWARAAEANPRVAAANMVYAEINSFAYPVDFPVRGRTVTHSHRWQKAQLRALTEEFTHVLVEAQMPPLGGMYSQNVRRQIRMLQAGGTSVAMVCHGSDIRLPTRHRALEARSPFVNDDWVPVAKLEKVVADNKRLLDDLGLPTFVSTPGLLLDVPYAHFLPVVIDSGLWKTSMPILERARPRVLHVPSNPLVKGTAEIEPAVSGMHAREEIEYVQATGLPHAEMPALYSSVDIVLDQFRLGDYGAGACEAMAAGRLVISHVSQQVRDVISSQTGVQLPILEANIDTLGQILRDVMENREGFRALAAKGPDVVRRVHNGDMARANLERYFLDTSGN